MNRCQRSPRRFAALMLLCACAPQPEVARKDQAAVPAHVFLQDNTLDIGDTFEVRVYGEADLSGKYRVGGDGTIDFPMLGTIKVAGMLPSQVSHLIASRLKQGLIRDPQVSVFVEAQTSKKVVVIGQVTRPGTFPYTAGMTIIEAITQAGGFTPVAAKNALTVTRIEEGRKVTYQVKAADISAGVAGNFYVRPGDIVQVPERFF